MNAVPRICEGCNLSFILAEQCSSLQYIVELGVSWYSHSDGNLAFHQLNADEVACEMLCWGVQRTQSMIHLHDGELGFFSFTRSVGRGPLGVIYSY